MKKGRDMKAFGQKGFTLIELMITVAIVAILAAIAYPSYTQYVIRGHRAAAQAEMMDIANRQQQFFLANRVYASSLDDLGYSVPPEVDKRYSLNPANMGVDIADTPPSFTITFVPKSGSSQATDVTLTLDATGNKEPKEKWK